MSSVETKRTSWFAPFAVFDWTPYQLVWLGVFTALAAAQTLFYEAGWFTFSVFLSGSLCVLLAAKGHILNYVVGFYNGLAYAWIAHVNGLYGEVWLNLLFYTPMAIVGLLAWRRNMAGSRVLMRGLSPNRQIAVVAAMIAATTASAFSFRVFKGRTRLTSTPPPTFFPSPQRFL